MCFANTSPLCKTESVEGSEMSDIVVGDGSPPAQEPEEIRQSGCAGQQQRQ